MALIVRRGPKKLALGDHSGTDQCSAWGGRRHEGHDAAVTQGGGVLLTNCTIVYSTLNFHRLPRVEEQCGMISPLYPLNKMLNVLSETNLAMALMDRRRSQWDQLQMALDE